MEIKICVITILLSYANIIFKYANIFDWAKQSSHAHISQSEIVYIIICTYIQITPYNSYNKYIHIYTPYLNYSILSYTLTYTFLYIFF